MIKRLVLSSPSLWLIWQFYKSHRRIPNLIRPQGMNEKILRRQLFDRRPILQQVGNKFTARDYIRARVGDEHVVQWITCVDRMEELDPATLPAQCVIKASHGSGWVEFVRDRDQTDWGVLKRKVNAWMSRDYGEEMREWCYIGTPRKIIVEEYLSDGVHDVPLDFKVFCFSGKVRMIQVDHGRFIQHTRNLYSPDWKRFDFEWGCPRLDPEDEKPRALPEMIALAERASSGWDFVRVDFYCVGERLLIGEMTNYPAAGRKRFTPVEADRLVGSWWT